MNPYKATIQKYNIPETYFRMSAEILDSQNLILCCSQIEKDLALVEFLEKINQAVFGKKGKPALTVFIESDQNFRLAEWSQHKIEGAVICFGISAEQLCFQGVHELHQLYHWQGIQLIFTEDLSEYFTNAQKKAKLWSVLQTIQ
ncbi:MAG: hypothetical protein IPH93_04485 [Saprospiraceae bacterium]|nr:hypothetical protein [Saprospiraceae bacterium]